MVTTLEPAPGALGLDEVAALLEELGSDGRLVHLERSGTRAARFGELSRPLPAALAQAVGDEPLWCHQAQAIDAARAGRSIVVATGTGSGKSLCYQLPIGEAALAPLRPGTSLLLFPTKALAADQLRALVGLGLPRVVAATYDGDCSTEERSWVRNRANAVLTNPEMLHHGILPHHDRWARFLTRLSYVVVDELHVLRGIFGTHVAHLLRRLRRLCAHYGSSPTFIFTSATIGDPAGLAEELCGLPVTAITDDGSPRGERVFALWNPPFVEGRGTRASSSSEAAAVAAALLRAGRKTLVFCRSRKGTEVLAADLKRRLPRALADQVRPYRSGYLSEERREIEAALFGGELRGVVATSALELGVDIAGLDACVLTGFPGTMASLWQQAGRAGRGMADGVIVLVAGDDQLDQWLMHHPTEVFNRPLEPAVVNPTNPNVMLPHLQCAAFEQPLTHLDRLLWGDALDDGVRELVVGDELLVRRRRNGPVATWSGRGWPSHAIGLRNASRGEVKIISEDGDRRLVGTVDSSRAPNLVHPGAVYLHQGVTYRVSSLDLDELTALVEPCDGDEYTMARTTVAFRLLAALATRTVGRAGLALGLVEVCSQVTGYQRVESRSRTILGSESLDLPPSLLRTRAVWYTVGPDQVDAAEVAPVALGGALHAIEHAAIGMLPLFAICDRWDVGGVSTALATDTGLPTIMIYDGYPGGAGIADLAFGAADRHLVATLSAIAACPCPDGCPSCVQSPKCGNGNEPLDKAAAQALLQVLLGTHDLSSCNIETDAPNTTSPVIDLSSGILTGAR